MNIAGLPKWAQTHIDRLNRRINELESSLDEARNKFAEPGAWIDPYDAAIPVASFDDRVRFGTDPGDRVNWIDVRRLSDDTFEIMAAETCAVIPQSGNVVLVKVGVRR